MQILLIIQELHGLARDSIRGYEKVMSAWAGRPELDEIENQQVSRRVILQDLRKAIERYKGDFNAMAPSDGYRAINERQLTGHPSEMRGVLDDLLRGENYYLYRIDDARTRFPAIAAHIANIHSTIRDNRDVLSNMLAREETVSSISIDHPKGSLEESLPAEADAPLITASIPDDSSEVSTPVGELTPVDQPARELVKASDAQIPVNYRQSASNSDSVAIDDVDAVDPLPEPVDEEDGEILTLDANQADDSENESNEGPILEGHVLDVAPRLKPETEIDLLPVHSFDYDLGTTSPSPSSDTDFDVDDSVLGSTVSGDDLERRIEASMPNIAPLDAPGNLRKNIMTRRGRFDPDAVRADANEVEEAMRRI